MKKTFLTSLMLLLITTISMAQRCITGTVLDNDTKEGVIQATISLLKKDSTALKSVVSDTNGRFTVYAPNNGQFILKISSVAYKTMSRRITVKGDADVKLGNVMLMPDSKMLKEAIVTGQAAKVVLKEDTFVYNAAAFHTPEGSAIEELVKRLPGAQVSDDGKITINGKEVKKIRVDGKEFMTGDTETALKNLPTSIIEKVKAYDEKSDLARITGIDDGDESTVLDFGIKRGMNKGVMVNADLAIGTKDRYTERMMGAYMKDDLRVMGFGGANNTGDRGFPGGGGGPRFGGGNNGLNASKMLGVNMNYEKKDVIKIDGSVRWNHRDGDIFSTTSGENFLSSVSSFNNSRRQEFSRNNSWNIQMRLEWTPDTMTNIMFRPTISTSTRDSRGTSTSATFNDDPYKFTTDPLNSIDLLAENDIVVNTNDNRSLSYTESTNLGGMLQVNRKLNSKGRNVTLRVDANSSTGQSESSSVQDIRYYLDPSIQMTRRYNTTPTKDFSYTLRTTYSEPLGKAYFLQLGYSYKYSKSRSDRSTYSYDNIPGFSLWMPMYRQWDDFFAYVDDPFAPEYYDDNLSKFSEYTNYTHEINAQVMKTTKNLRMSVGVMAQPQRSHFVQNYQGVSTDTIRNVVNFTPSLDFRYKFSKVSQLRMVYRGNTQQPSMTDLLDIVDDSNPLNITMGNPGLKPSFTQSFRLFYNGYAQSHMRSWMTHINFSTTSNSISQKVTYDPTTGGRTTRPENIDGNWNLGGAIMFNTSIDSAGVWNLNTFTNINYQNHVSYLFQNNITEKNTTRSTTISERLAFSYRSSWLEVEPNGNVSYQRVRNLLQESNNLDTWAYNWGININITAPWGTGFSTDAHMNSRRGYNDAALNTDEFVLNAQVSQSFLKGKALTLSLQIYDLLRQQSTLSRSISSTQRTDTEYNSINAYAMLHCIFRFNSFGGKMAHPGGGDRPNFNDPRFSRAGMGGGRRF